MIQNFFFLFLINLAFVRTQYHVRPIRPVNILRSSQYDQSARPIKYFWYPKNNNPALLNSNIFPQKFDYNLDPMKIDQVSSDSLRPTRLNKDVEFTFEPFDFYPNSEVVSQNHIPKYSQKNNFLYPIKPIKSDNQLNYAFKDELSKFKLLSFIFNNLLDKNFFKKENFFKEDIKENKNIDIQDEENEKNDEDKKIVINNKDKDNEETQADNDNNENDNGTENKVKIEKKSENYDDDDEIELVIGSQNDDENMKNNLDNNELYIRKNDNYKYGNKILKPKFDFKSLQKTFIKLTSESIVKSLLPKIDKILDSLKNNSVDILKHLMSNLFKISLELFEPKKIKKFGSSNKDLLSTACHVMKNFDYLKYAPEPIKLFCFN